jgi:hypothetical protein
MNHWIELAGLGPWTCFRNIELAAKLDGRDFSLRIHEALAYMGDLQIQLVQSLNPIEETTPYSEFLRAGHFGLHHMAFFSDDVEADVARARSQGFGRICSMRDKSGYRYFYCQSQAMPGMWIELGRSGPDREHRLRDDLIAITGSDRPRESCLNE